jgi:hypothetical protein
MTAPRERRFWLWYGLAWLALWALYLFAFASPGRVGVRQATFGALANTLPDALLGAGLVVLLRRSWRAGVRGRRAFLAGLAGAFTATALALKVLLTILLVRLDGGTMDWSTFDRGVLAWQGFFSLLACAVLGSVTFAGAAAERLRREESRRAEAELVRARAELKTLRAQLNPHFLFNTLHSVRALVRESPAAAEGALEQLGDLLRYTLRIQDAEDDGVLLREEWEFVQAYLALEKLRLGERLRVVAEASDAALQSVVPAFVLQPLVENAIRHGLSPRERGGTVWIRAELAGEELRLEVRDDGTGASGSATKGTGKGLDLVRQRLHALYGAAGAVAVTASAGAGFAVALRFPRTFSSW